MAGQMRRQMGAHTDRPNAGAAAAMVDDSAAAAGYRPLLQVGDALTGLNGLGQAARKRTGATVIAVTGSVGKTGVKEALAALLGAQGKTGHSVGSFNNHIGVPLSLARLAPGAGATRAQTSSARIACAIRRGRCR